MPSTGQIVGDPIEIGDPQLRELATQILQTLQLSTEKALAHRADPTAFPLAAESDSADRLMLRIADAFPESKRNRAIEKAVSAVNAPAQERQARLGGLSQVNLRSATSVEAQVRARQIPASMRFSEAHLAGLHIAEGKLVARKLRKVQDLKLFPAAVEPASIAAKYQSLGGASGFLGSPKGAEGVAPDGVGRYRHYQGGSIYWSPKTGAHEVHGAILQKYLSFGAPANLLGYPGTDEETSPDGIGRYNHFEKGSIYWSPQTGAHEVHGAILQKYVSLGPPAAVLGYPVTDETPTPDKVGRFNHFQQGSIYWTPQLGAHTVHLDVRNKWEELGWELGYLGFPQTDTKITGGGATKANTFEGGTITWRANQGATVSNPVTKVQFHVHELTCVSETSGPGDDDIAMGAVVTDSLLHSKRILLLDETEFNDGDVKGFSPPLTHEFNLLTPLGWPKSFVVSMLLVEIDHGGFNDDLKELLEKIQGLVKSELVKLGVTTVTALIGGAAGSIAGPAGTVIGAIIGALIGWLVDSFFGWLIGLFEDDAFLPISASLSLKSIHDRFSGKTHGSVGSWWVQGHGGRYEFKTDWELVP